METRREHQAFNDGKLAFVRGWPYSRNPRRSSSCRVAWWEGWCDSSRRAAQAKLTPEQRAEAARAAAQLREWCAAARALRAATPRP